MGKNSKTIKRIMNNTKSRIVLQKSNKNNKNSRFLIETKSLNNLISAYDRLTNVSLNSNIVIPRDFFYKTYNKNLHYPYTTYINQDLSPESPTYSPESPTYTPESPTYSPESPNL